MQTWLETLRGFEKYFFTILYLIIIGLQIYALFFVFPAERKVFSACNRRLLCEYGSLPQSQCYGFEYGKYYNPNPIYRFFTPMRIRNETDLNETVSGDFVLNITINNTRN